MDQVESLEEEGNLVLDTDSFSLNFLKFQVNVHVSATCNLQQQHSPRPTSIFNVNGLKNLVTNAMILGTAGYMG